MPITDPVKRAIYVNAWKVRKRRKITEQSNTGHLTPGTPVRHPTHGDGSIVGEWGRMKIVGDGACYSTSCQGIYDCVFGSGGGRHWHSCRVEFLERIL